MSFIPMMHFTDNCPKLTHFNWSFHCSNAYCIFFPVGYIWLHRSDTCSFPLALTHIHTMFPFPQTKLDTALGTAFNCFIHYISLLWSRLSPAPVYLFSPGLQALIRPTKPDTGPHHELVTWTCFMKLFVKAQLWEMGEHQNDFISAFVCVWLFEHLHALLKPRNLFIVNCFMFRDHREITRGEGFSLQHYRNQVLKVSARMQSRLKHWLVLIIIHGGPYFLGHSMQRGHIFGGDGAPVRRWGQRNPFTPCSSHSSRSADTEQLSCWEECFHFTKNIHIHIWL